MSDVSEVLGPDGLLADKISGFAFRQQQLDMAEAVADAIDKGHSLISEAGTGTGKTFAYLVPALLSGRKVIISTGTKNLQDQLYHRDLPVIRDALALPGQTALLKGRANYLCIQRLETAATSGRLPLQQASTLFHVREWAGRTQSGDIAELGLPESSPIWPWVTSTTDNCLGQECPDLKKCHLAEARRRAQEADLVVVNHHLLCADLALKEEGFGEILPGADCFIIDEAHQLPDVASNFFGMTVSARQINELAKDVETEYHKEAGDVPEVIEQADLLKKAVRDLRLCFGVEPKRGPWSEIGADGSVQGALNHLDVQLDRLGDHLDAISGRGKGLDKCLSRCADLRLRLKVLVGDESDEAIRWYETHKQGFHLNRTPLEISEIFRNHMGAHQASWIFTSATLAVAGNFDHFSHQIGVEDAVTGCWDSPFDYPNQGLFFVPKNMPQPQERGYNQAVAELTLPIIQASRGRAFLLYTSHRALREAAEWFEERTDFPLLVQGTAPKAELLERFRSSGNGVLLGTASFWEGVDVRGDALSCVVIDKLPFASPGDPVLQARIDALRRRGGNPFRDFQLPQAVIALKQGAGRLIRDVTDRGVLVICDPRLLKRSYGYSFLNSLPAMSRSRDIKDVQAFFADEPLPQQTEAASENQ